jgi:hypothetical protein
MLTVIWLVFQLKTLEFGHQCAGYWVGQKELPV